MHVVMVSIILAAIFHSLETRFDRSLIVVLLPYCLDRLRTNQLVSGQKALLPAYTAAMTGRLV